MDIKQVIGSVLDVASPLVNAFVPGGTMITAGIKAIAGAFGLTEDEVTGDKLKDLMAQDKEFALKLRQADQAYQIELLKQQLDDVKNARQMNVETTKATGKRDINLYVLSWTLVIGFFALVGLLVFRELPKDTNGVVCLLFGTLATGFGCVIQYYFGSSKSSQDKTELLSKAQPIK